jgi:hypothetical protein
MRLPGVLKEIADAAGEPAAVLIAAAHGGSRVYIPAKVTDGHWLVECIGRDKADRVCAHFGGGKQIDIPMAGYGTYPQLYRKVAQLIHSLDKAGASARQIRKQVGVTERTVHRHRSRHRGGPKNSRQGSLF